MTEIIKGTKLEHIPTRSEGIVLNRTKVIPDGSIVKITNTEARCHHKRGDGHIWEDRDVYILGGES